MPKSSVVTETQTSTPRYFSWLASSNHRKDKEIRPRGEDHQANPVEGGRSPQRTADATYKPGCQGDRFREVGECA